MALQAVVTQEEVEGLEESIQQLYTEARDKDGNPVQDQHGNPMYALQVQGLDSHPEVGNLKSALDRKKSEVQQVRQERDQYKATVDKLPEDMGIEELLKARDQARNKGDDERVRQLQQEYEQRLAEKDQELEQERTQRRQENIARELSDALEAAGVTRPSLKAGAMELLRKQTYIDDEGRAVQDTSMGPKPIAEAVKAWANTAEGKDYVTQPAGGGARGSGPGGNTGPNPWSSGEWNTTEQARIAREDPERAKRLARAARKPEPRV